MLVATFALFLYSWISSAKSAGFPATNQLLKRLSTLPETYRSVLLTFSDHCSRVERGFERHGKFYSANSLHHGPDARIAFWAH